MPEPEASGAAWVYLLNTCSLLLPVTVHGIAIELPCLHAKPALKGLSAFVNHDILYNLKSRHSTTIWLGRAAKPKARHTGRLICSNFSHATLITNLAQLF